MEKKYFCGNEISEYGMEHGKVDYRCLAKAFDGVLNNDIMEKTQEIGYWELENGSDCYYEDTDGEIYYEYSDMDDRCDEIDEQIQMLEDSRTEEPEDEEEYEEWEKLNNEIDDKISELESEKDYLREEHYEDVFQWFIIDDCGASILKDYTHEIVYYNEELDMYLWGVTHYGTSWDYVLTEIAC